MTAPARAALYTAEGSTLIACARHAERAGLRVVTMVDEDQPGVGLAGAGLDALVDRLGDGEFEVIVADAGDGRVVTIAGVPAEVTPTVTDVRCVIYVRCATPSQATPYPLADQWDACETYAVQQGWDTISVYKDNAVSELKGSRHSLDAQMREAERGAFDNVLVEDVSRLSRDALQVHRLLAELKALGVAVHTLHDGLVGEVLQ